MSETRRLKNEGFIQNSFKFCAVKRNLLNTDLFKIKVKVKIIPKSPLASSEYFVKGVFIHKLCLKTRHKLSEN